MKKFEINAEIEKNPGTEHKIIYEASLRLDTPKKDSAEQDRLFLKNYDIYLEPALKEAIKSIEERISTAIGGDNDITDLDLKITIAYRDIRQYK